MKSLLLISLAFFATQSPVAASSSATVPSVSSYVDTRIGSGGSGVLQGCINPGAQVPYGAMRLGPDTSMGLEPFRSDANCGYQYKDSQIMCFSHTHLVGAGVTDFQNFGVTVVRDTSMNGVIEDAKYGSNFSHSSEVAIPGYYAVTLERWNTRAEVTVGGTHAGMHRYTCYAYDNKNCTVLMDICHTSWPAPNKWIPNGACKSARIDAISFNDGEKHGGPKGSASISAWIDNFGGFSKMVNIGIHIHFQAYVTAVGVTSGKPYPFVENTNSALCWMANRFNAPGLGCEPFLGVNTPTRSLGALFTVDMKDVQEDIQFEVRTAISFQSADNAYKLLQTQLKNTTSGAWFTFDELRSQTEQIWEETLGRVEVNPGPGGATAASRQLTSYYSSLYRTHLAPTIYTEFGNFRSENQHIDQVPDESYEFMSDLSIWDIYRSEMPLTMFLEPKVARNVAWSMSQMYKERGGNLPVWVLANVETFCMVGEHSAVIMADFLRKGLKGLNNTEIYEILVKAIRQQNQEKMAAPLYYHPYMSSSQYGSGSDTLDFAVDAAAVRNTALMMGDSSVAEEFEPYANAWKHIWNTDRQLFCPKTPNGTWVCPEDEWKFVFGQLKYREGNAGQYRWYVPQDMTGLVDSFKSKDSYAQTLNDFFALGQLFPNETLGSPDPYFWAGNEPDVLAPAQFAAAGNEYSWLTDKWVAATLKEYYTADPNFRGLPGNDDYGTLSAFEFLSMSGFYPVSSTNEYVLMTPWFQNNTFYVSAESASYSPFPGAAATIGKKSSSRKGISRQCIIQVNVANHPGTAALWTGARGLNGVTPNGGGNSFYYIQSAKINGVPLKSRIFSHQNLLANVKAGETIVIDVTLAEEPVVFGEVAPSAGGPNPWMPSATINGTAIKEGILFYERNLNRKAVLDNAAMFSLKKGRRNHSREQGSK